jgi:glycerol-3-phosphate acyltransferase PlsY
MLTYQNIIIIIIAYLLGSIPSSVWIGEIFFNKDVRKYGSKNAGATNAIRVLGLKAGIPVLITDTFKGWLAVNLVSFIKNNFVPDTDAFINFQIILAISALIGHIFPVYVGFKGGKGVATLLGIAIALYPYAIIVTTGIFIIVFIITKYISLSSVISAIAFPFIVIFIFNSKLNFWLIMFSIATGIFVLITHRKNIKRLLKGEETKFKFKKEI